MQKEYKQRKETKRVPEFGDRSSGRRRKAFGSAHAHKVATAWWPNWIHRESGWKDKTKIHKGKTSRTKRRQKTNYKNHEMCMCLCLCVTAIETRMMMESDSSSNS